MVTGLDAGRVSGLVRVGLIAALVTFLSGFAISPVLASTLEQTSMPAMVAHAKMIFQGRVLSSSVGQGESGPTTCFIFQADHVLKGDSGAAKVRLCFLGGRTGKYELSIGDMIFPKVGEHGIYFVESLSQVRANPLSGWSQGHFLVRKNAGAADTVTTNDGRDILAVADKLTPVKGGGAVKISSGVAAGIAVRRPSQALATGQGAMTVTDFKASIVRLLKHTGGGARK